MPANVLTKIPALSKLVQMESIDPQVTLKAWEERGYRGGTWVDPPGRAWENFVHDVDELMMLVSGELELEVAGQKSYPQPGQEILIAARAVHSVRNRGSGTARWVYAYKTAAG
jgi:mannose-6-phosphate isomerase-like protein (cupin superfamily)